MLGGALKVWDPKTMAKNVRCIQLAHTAGTVSLTEIGNQAKGGSKNK